jgi:hypothetical protein
MVASVRDRAIRGCAARFPREADIALFAIFPEKKKISVKRRKGERAAQKLRQSFDMAENRKTAKPRILAKNAAPRVSPRGGVKERSRRNSDRRKGHENPEADAKRRHGKGDASRILATLQRGAKWVTHVRLLGSSAAAIRPDARRYFGSRVSP